MSLAGGVTSLPFTELLKRHVPVWLLVLWVALIIFVPVPWTPQVCNDTEPVFHHALILSDGYVRTRSIAYDAMLLDSTRAFGRKARVTLYFSKDSTIRYRAGDIVIAKTTLTRNSGYVRKSDAAVLTHLRGREIRLTDGQLYYYAMRCRSRIAAIFTSFFSGNDELALVNALLLGDKRALSTDQREAFADAGAMHVLAVSGLHTGIIHHVLVFILTLGGLIVIPWEKKGLRILQQALIISGVWVYALITGLAISVMRSALMFSFLPLGKMHMESPLKYNRLAAAALIILFINPTALYSPSFLLSFSAVLAIMYFVPRWQQALPDTRGNRVWRMRWPRRIARLLAGGLFVSVAAQIGVLPWTLLFFGQVSNYFALTNLIVVPLTCVLVWSCLIALLVSTLHLPITVTAFTMKCCEWEALAMNRSVSWLQSLNGATSFFTFTPAMAVVLVLLIISLSAIIPLYKTHRRLSYVTMAVSAVLVAVLLFLYSMAVGIV